MAQAPALGHEEPWKCVTEGLKKEWKDLVKEHPEAKADMKRVYSILNNMASLAMNASGDIVKNEEWSCIIRRIDAGRRNLCRQLEPKSLFGSLYGVLLPDNIGAEYNAASQCGKDEGTSCSETPGRG
jgi:hypothetical protein